MTALPMPYQFGVPYAGTDMAEALRKRQAYSNLSRIGQGLLMASAQGMPIGQGLAYGLSQTKSPDPLQMMQLGAYRDQQRERQARQTARSKLLGGYDPQTGITWNTGRPGLLDKPEGASLLAQSAPEAFTSALATQMFKSPETTTDVAGYRRYLTGPQAGQRVFPDARAQTYGAPKFDANVGKWYQINPKTGKREYTSPQTGMEISFDSEGNPVIRTGVTGGGGGLTKSVRTDVQKKIISAGDTLAHLSSIRQRFRPEFQQVGTRWDTLKSSWKSKLGFDITPDERQLLTDFTAYRADAGQLFALTLKDLSGVAVNPTEFKRAENWLPNPGTGIFDGDSPDELLAKVDRFDEFTRRALLKRHYINKRGLTINDVDVDDMPGIIRKRGDQLEAQYREQGLQGQPLIDAVKASLADEFGIGTLGGLAR